MSMKINQLAVSFKQHPKCELTRGEKKGKKRESNIMKEEKYGTRRKRENTERKVFKMQRLIVSDQQDTSSFWTAGFNIKGMTFETKCFVLLCASHILHCLHAS